MAKLDIFMIFKKRWTVPDSLLDRFTEPTAVALDLGSKEV